MRKTLRIAAGMVAGGLLLAACAMPSLPGAPTTATQAGAQQSESNLIRVTAKQGNIEDKVVGTGAITAKNTVDVAFQASGTVKQVLVKEGDRVEAGQPIATIDDTDLQLSVKSAWASYLSAQAAFSETVKGPTSADVKKAQAALASAQAAYNDLFKDPTDTDLVQLQADLQSAEADLKSAQAAYDRRAGRDPGVGGSQEALSLEKATIAYNKAKAAYDAKFAEPSAASVASASSQIQSARAALSALQPISETIEQKRAQVDQAYISWQQADNKLKYATLIAPMAGLITDLMVVKGATVNSGATAATIAEYDEPVFVLNVDEADLGAVKVGAEARVRLQTYSDQQIPATVTFISPVGTSANGITTYAVDLTIPKTNDTPNILLNMSGTGEIITAQEKDAVLIPYSAVTEGGQGSNKVYSVLVAGANAQPQSVTVTLGKRSGSNVQILSGVKAGDVILYTPAASTSTSSTSAQNNNPGFGGPPPGP
jgi:HlyD family secretion protein